MVVPAIVLIACLAIAGMTQNQFGKHYVNVASCLSLRCATLGTEAASADGDGLWNGALPGSTSFVDSASVTRNVPTSTKRSWLWLAF